MQLNLAPDFFFFNHNNNIIAALRESYFGKLQISHTHYKKRYLHFAFQKM